jgi:ATP-binding cassette subfamily F protein uup
MRDESEQRIKREGKAKFYVESGDPSGRKVIETFKVNHAFQGMPLIKNFSIKIKRGDRIGIIGNNGVGKSTLLRILLGEITPDSGTVKLGTNLQIGYFDQIRRELDPERTVASIIGDGKDYIIVNDKERHVIGYMRNFLFAPERSMTKVKSLSGGECNRVLLARLFTRPSNLLVLDEPTNDLDVEMLEVLEEQLAEYDGTLLIVSHDRQFLDNVVDRILVFEEDGGLKEYVGGYSDWVKRGLELKISEQESLKAQGLTNTAGATGRSPLPDTKTEIKKPGKLSYKLQRELDLLPQQIDELEVAKNILEEQIAHPDFYNQPFEITEPVLQALTDKHWEIHRATERWIELQEMAEGSS